MAKVLVVDDEANLRKVLAAMLRRDGYDVSVAPDGEVGLAEVNKNGADVVVTDLVMPKLGGLDLLKILNTQHPDVPVIIITAHGTVDSAVEAIKLGAFDYITKPFDQAELTSVIAKAVRTHAAAMRSVRPDGKARAAIIGESPQMQEIFRVIDKVADTPSTVLITGESGTGKELIATALYEGSSRRGKPFIKINCAAIPKDLIESELFGYEKGAFTGAVTSKPGRFELADTGTLFLDEIGEIPVEMQVKLLRALQESEFERVGGIKTTHVDVRLIAATNRTSALSVCVPPSRSNSLSCKTRKSFTCTAGVMSPISSRNSVPPCASSTRPGLRDAAPVNAPFSYPNSSLSSSVSGSAAQWSFTSGPARRGLWSWMARAASSFPVPLSPRTSTVAVPAAARLIRSCTSRIAAEEPTKAECGSPGTGF